MKQAECKDVIVNEVKYHIFPFSAFKSANISGELVKIVSRGMKADASVADIDFDKGVSAFAEALASISGDEVERLMRKLLIENHNISFDHQSLGAKWLDEDFCNELFSGDVFGMYTLAWEVIKVNFGGFFGWLGSLSGGVPESLTRQI